MSSEAKDDLDEPGYVRWLMTLAAPCSIITSILADDVVPRILSLIAGACFAIYATALWIRRAKAGKRN